MPETVVPVTVVPGTVVPGTVVPITVEQITVVQMTVVPGTVCGANNCSAKLGTAVVPAGSSRPWRTHSAYCLLEDINVPCIVPVPGEEAEECCCEPGLGN